MTGRAIYAKRKVMQIKAKFARKESLTRDEVAYLFEQIDSEAPVLNRNYGRSGYSGYGTDNDWGYD